MIFFNTFRYEVQEVDNIYQTMLILYLYTAQHNTLGHLQYISESLQKLSEMYKSTSLFLFWAYFKFYWCVNNQTTSTLQL